MGGLTPWFKFYPGDWQSDQQLRICSLAARGLWIECMAIMHKASPYGLLIVNGQPLTDAQIAMLVGTSPDQLSPLLAELENAGVFSRTRTGVIYSRRMTRDEKRRKDGVKSKISGRIEGSRRSKQDTENKGENLPPSMVVGMVASEPPSTQISEARYQKEKNSLRSPKKATRLPEDWTLPEELREYARSQGMPPEAISREAENFRDYWSAKPGKDGTKADWPATWRMWVRRACERQGYSPPPAKTNGHGPSPPQSTEEAAIRLKAGRDRGQWPRAQWGPAPFEEGCLIPPELIQPTDRGWAEWEKRGF